MARQTRNRRGPGTVQHRLPVPTATELPARPATVLTSVCALGFPALAFSRSSSKGISMSAFMGPLPRQKQTDRTSRGWSCHLSEWTGHRSGRQAWSSASRGNQVSGAWGCRGHHSDPAPRGGARTANVGAAAQSPPWVSQEGRGAQAWCHHRPSAHCSSNYGSRKARGSGLKAPGLRKEPTPQ